MSSKGSARRSTSTKAWPRRVGPRRGCGRDGSILIINLSPTVLEIRTSAQVNGARKFIQELATIMDFGTLERTKFVTAASELARLPVRNPDHATTGVRSLRWPARKTGHATRAIAAGYGRCRLRHP